MDSEQKIEVVLGKVVLSYDPEKPLRPEISPHERPVLIRGLESASRLAALAALRLFAPGLTNGDSGIKIDAGIRRELIFLREAGMSGTANEVIGYYQKLRSEMGGL